MRKMVKIFLMFLIFSFFSIFQVKAASLTNNSYCEEALDVDGEPVQICHFVFDVDGTVTYNQNSLSLTLTNVVIKSIQVENGWYYTKVHDNLYTFETSNPTLSGHVEMATIVFQKINEAEECSIHYSCDWSKIDRSCSIFEGNYYGPNGDIITELEYEKQCLKPVCKDYGDGTYSDKNGNLVDYLTYTKQCETHTCEILSDGTKYGPDGKVTTDFEYMKYCEKPLCRDYGDGTYSDTDGNLVDYLTFTKLCGKHVCEIVGGDTYYGSDGTIVDKETYDAECNVVYTCEVVDGIYYDDEGNVVDVTTFEEICGVVDNPQTGAMIPILYIVGGVGVVGAIWYFTNRFKKFYKMK